MTRHVRWRNIALAAALLGLLLQAEPVQAQATRTWVSGDGDDVNPCSYTAPCKTFAGAIAKTAAGGEIDVLKPGGYGSVTIRKSISIVSAGAAGAILAAQANGITIMAGPNDVVDLQGLIINGAGTGQNGIQIVSAARVNIRKCSISGFTTGVNVAPTGLTSIVLSDCTITNNNGNGVVNQDGGVGGVAAILLDRVQVVQNQGDGILADGPAAVIELNNSVIAHNGAVGINSANAGQILSFKNNAVYGNRTDGNPTNHWPLQ